MAKPGRGWNSTLSSLAPVRAWGVTTTHRHPRRRPSMNRASLFAEERGTACPSRRKGEEGRVCSKHGMRSELTKLSSGTPANVLGLGRDRDRPRRRNHRIDDVYQARSDG